MNAPGKVPGAFWSTVPLAVLLAAATSPLLFLLSRFVERPEIDVSSLAPALGFAVSGAAVGASLGSVLGAILGTRDIPGRFAAILAATSLVAAPPAFWWIGLTRLSVAIGGMGGRAAASLVTGAVLAPITMLLVLAAISETPRAAYQAARVSLAPTRRVVYVLGPFIRPAILAGFLLTTIILLGESEIPFLFGFRTSMTDIVTTFAQTFDARRTLAIVIPLIGAVVVIAWVMVGPLFAVMLAPSREGRGVVRNPAGAWVGIAMFSVPGIGVLALAGYARAALSGDTATWLSLRVPATTVAVSIGEPLSCALVAIALAVLTAYPARRAQSARRFAVVGLLLFCVPAGLTAIGWIALGQTLGGVAVRPGVVHVTRMVGLAVLGFLIAYARVPDSLEHAGRLVPISSVRRAWTLNLPLVAASIAATAALIAALIFADRDVASLLLAPGESRLMLNLYLLSANAPSATIGATALAAFAVGGIVIGLAAAGPAIVLRATKP